MNKRGINSVQLLLPLLLGVAVMKVAAEEGAKVPSDVPDEVKPLAFNPSYPEWRYKGYQGGPGSNTSGRIYNSRTVGGHNLGIRYDDRDVLLYFVRDDGRELTIKVGAYWWPETDGVVRASVFLTDDEEKILVCVGGVPVSVIFPSTLDATCIGRINQDDKFRWNSDAVRAFERRSPRQGEQAAALYLPSAIGFSVRAEQ